MDFDNPRTLIIVYAISNLIGLLYLLAAIKKTKLARLMFVLLFGWASCFNYILCHKHPEAYLMYGKGSVQFYANFINGWFKSHVTLFVSLIAIGQALITMGMLLKGIWVKLACIGVIIFLLSIALLGMYAAFPFSIFVSLSAYFIIKKDDKDYLWKLGNYSKKTTL
jgi:hypothetical protein